MGGIVFQTKKDQIGFVTQEEDREYIGYDVKNSIFRRLWVDSDCIEKLDLLDNQKKSQKFSDTIMDLLNDPDRGTTYIN